MKITKEKSNLYSLYKILWTKLDSNNKKNLYFLLFLMIIVSAVEIISIGTAIPFLTILISTEIGNNENFKFLNYLISKNQSKEQIVLIFCILFGFFALLAGFLRLYLIWRLNFAAFEIGKLIGNKIYKNVLNMDYKFHVEINSSNIINALSNQTNLIVYNVVLPLLVLISSLIMIIVIISGLFYINSTVAIASVFGFGMLYISIIFLTKKLTLSNSQIISINSARLVKTVQEGLGSIREIILNNTQDYYWNLYKKIDTPLRKAQILNSVISNFPRYAIEGISMVLIALFAYLLIDESGGLNLALPILGTFALAAQRLMPLMQQAYSSLILIRGEQYSFADAMYLLDKKSDSECIVTNSNFINGMNRNLELQNISYSTQNLDNTIFENINLYINKGSRVGFIGETGSGKSTLMDIIMTLKIPQEGSIFIDGVLLNSSNSIGWRKSISHVPQEVYLTDSSFLENIALGTQGDNVDMDEIYLASKQAKIHDFIMSLPNQYLSFVGERGIRLSGGQKQRIGIARALYKKPSLIIFDEATSALDLFTESEVMESIYSLNKNLTVLIVTHRINTLQKCDVIYRLENKKIYKI